MFGKNKENIGKQQSVIPALEARNVVDQNKKTAGQLLEELKKDVDNLSVNKKNDVGTIPYHQTKEIIEKETLLKGEDGQDKKADISFTKEKDETKISFELDKNFDLTKIISTILLTIGKMESNAFSSGYIYLSKGNDLNISLSPDMGYSAPRIEFKRTNDFKSEEIEAIVKTYKIGHKTDSIEKKRIEDPKKTLEALGATVFKPEDAPSWDFLAGYEKSKQQVKDTVILPLLHPEIFDQIARLTRKNYQSIRPKAVLFEGPPGTGKTTMARLIAGETKSDLVYVPIESIISKWYGESSKNLGGIFDACESIENCILFMDEIDSLATSRNGEMHEATRRILSVLLRKIDGFNQNNGTILIGATNRKDDLDPALLSRFNTSIEFGLPNEEERKSIMENYAQHLTNEDLLILAKNTEGKSGRDIKNLFERVERSWVSELITKQTESIEAPPIKKYLAEFEN